MVLSPVAAGNGAFVVHTQLAEAMANYQVLPFSPQRTYFPVSLYPLGRKQRATAIHATPDYGVFHSRRDIPLILTCHNYVLDDEFLDYGSWLQRLHWKTDLRWFHKMAFNRADVITAVSHFTANLTKQDIALEKPIKVIYNGVDEKKFTPIKQRKGTKEVRVLFSGNLTRRKGAHWLLPIINKLDENISIYYTAGLREESELVSHPRLVSLGSIPHEKMPGIYQGMDILLFPTVREGHSMAVLEAMACGLPIVASDISSLPEQVAHEQGGFLCQLGDVDAFAGAISKLAEDRQMRSAMGEYNRSVVEQCFTLNRMLAEYRELFGTLLKN